VKHEEEVGSTNCLQMEPIDLNHFFGEDGKIYGYNGLQVPHYVPYYSVDFIYIYIYIYILFKCNPFSEVPFFLEYGMLMFHIRIYFFFCDSDKCLA
jgi:hypothetical protein